MAFILRFKRIFELKVTKVSLGTPQTSVSQAYDGSQVHVTLTFGRQNHTGFLMAFPADLKCLWLREGGKATRINRKYASLWVLFHLLSALIS